MTQPVLNPVELPADLFPAEVEFARCLARGIPCTVGNGELPEEAIQSGKNANVVRGEVIRFFAYGGDPDKHPIRGAVIDLRGAWILGMLDLLHANIPYALDLNCCRFVAPVIMLHAGCGALYLNGSHLAKGLDADGITTKGGVNLRDGFSAEGEVRLLSANVGGNLSCAGGRFRNPKGDALNADGIMTQGDVNLRYGFSAEGEVRLLGANVGGNLSCEGGKFHNPEGNALSADGLTTKGGVNLRNGFSAEGEVRLLGASVGGDLSCGGGSFHNPKGYALNADRLTTKGDVNLGDGFSAKGEVRLLGANVGGDLSCEGGKFHNPKGNALNADGITAKGDVVLCDGFSAEGEVRLPDANVGGRLSCEDGRFYNLEGCALDVEGAIINGGFIWREISGGGRVVLGHAKVGVFADDADSWKPFDVVLDGFTYNSFAGPVDAQFRLDWLGSRPQGMRFSPLPYEQAAKVLFGMGQAKEAREILLEKERLQTADKRTPLLRKIGRWLWDVFAGYGYRLRKTAAWMAGFVLVGAFLFNFANDNGRIVPHQPVVLADMKYREVPNPPCAELKCTPEKRPTELVKRLFPDYPEFNALAYSADVFIPFFALHQEPYWYPNPSGSDREILLLILPFWYWLEIGAGWVLTSLFLLSITGLLRPRQSSGEKG